MDSGPVNGLLNLHILRWNTYTIRRFDSPVSYKTSVCPQDKRTAWSTQAPPLPVVPSGTPWRGTVTQTVCIGRACIICICSARQLHLPAPSLGAGSRAHAHLWDMRSPTTVPVAAMRACLPAQRDRGATLSPYARVPALIIKL